MDNIIEYFDFRDSIYDELSLLGVTDDIIDTADEYLVYISFNGITPNYISRNDTSQSYQGIIEAIDAAYEFIEKANVHNNCEGIFGYFERNESNICGRHCYIAEYVTSQFTVSIRMYDIS